MSGGHFDYKEHLLSDIIDELKALVRYNWKTEYPYNIETIKEFNKALKYCRLAQTYVHRIDYLVSGDDGEETFHEQLEKEIKKIK